MDFDFEDLPSDVQETFIRNGWVQRPVSTPIPDEVPQGADPEEVEQPEPPPFDVRTLTSWGRSQMRLEDWQQFYGGALGKRLYRLHELLHNNVVHPLLGLSYLVDRISEEMTGEYYPLSQLMVDLHHLSSHWLNNPGHWAPLGGNDLGGFKLERAPEVHNLKAWLLHNMVAHPLLGLFPGPRTGAYHDKTAHEMGVDHWV